MNSFQSLGVGLGISFVASVSLLAAISRPLAAFVGKICPDSESIGFWLRFAMVMIFLAPLFFTACFGLPSAFALQSLETGEIIRREVTATLIGASFAMVSMGIWVSSLARRSLPLASQNTYKTST